MRQSVGETIGRRDRRLGRLAAVALLLLLPARAFAQIPQPLPRIVLDAHGFMTSVGDAITASSLSVQTTDLPGKVRGFTAGATYFLRRGPGLALGIGTTVIIGRGRHTTVDPNGVLPDVKTATRLSGISGDFTLNFGQRNGWSYLAAGYGPVRLWSYLDDGTVHASPASMTLNAGGGARWFSSKHIAFSFDVRFYYTNPLTPTADFAGRVRTKLTVLSAGISFRR